MVPQAQMLKTNQRRSEDRENQKLQKMHQLLLMENQLPQKTSQSQLIKKKTKKELLKNKKEEKRRRIDQRSKIDQKLLLL
jgi:hypothetical protein